MAKFKIGELLIQEGLITPAELEDALKAQVIFGGKLGTNLIEMGVLEEDDIARVLSRKLKIAFIDGSELDQVPRDVLALLPRELAEKHKVIPLRLENRRLTLAMSDPTDLKAIDEVAFRTGFLVRPVIAAELRMAKALETYYQVARDLRYVVVHRPQVRRRPKPAAPPPEPKPAAPPPPPPEPKTRPQPAPPAAEPEIVVDLEEVVPEAPPAIEIDTPEDIDLEAAARKLCDAGSRDDIASLVMAWAGSRFSRAALFVVRSGAASGWQAAVKGKPVAGFDQLRIPLEEASVLKTVSETRSWYLGPIPRTPFNSMFLQQLGGEVPATALLLPLLMMGRVIAILYVDGSDSELRTHLQDLQRIAAKMVMAFEILVLKNKILVL